MQSNAASMEQQLVRKAKEFAKRELGRDATGHDWWHVHRVRNLALELAEMENADRFVCELAALLHDVADEKLNVSKEAGLDKVRRWLEEHGVGQTVIRQVMDIIATMSYNGGTNPPMTTLEGKVVQDADRLDALGAIGIARTFMYAGAKGHRMHEPGQRFDHLDYRSSEKTAVFHFYEKLLKVKELLNTEHARTIAEHRHRFMETFLTQFYAEWDARA